MKYKHKKQHKGLFSTYGLTAMSALFAFGQLLVLIVGVPQSFFGESIVKPLTSTLAFTIIGILTFLIFITLIGALIKHRGKW